MHVGLELKAAIDSSKRFKWFAYSYGSLKAAAYHIRLAFKTGFPYLLRAVPPIKTLKVRLAWPSTPRYLLLLLLVIQSCRRDHGCSGHHLRIHPHVRLDVGEGTSRSRPSSLSPLGPQDTAEDIQDQLRVLGVRLRMLEDGMAHYAAAQAAWVYGWMKFALKESYQGLILAAGAAVYAWSWFERAARNWLYGRVTEVVAWLCVSGLVPNYEGYCGILY